MGAESRVNEFYRGRNVFLTGGSGFMGKVLVEKMLYSIPDIGKVYILMRPKRGKSFSQRVDEMWMLPMFQRLREQNPSAKSKVHPVQGDMLLENLGVSDQDLNTLYNEVTVVMHFAATLRLEAPLKDCIDMNTAGTLRILNVTAKIKNLVMFVHLSTAFCYPDYEVLEETVQPCAMNPHNIMQSLKWLDVKQMELLRPTLLGPHPNGYTYSKRLAELLVADAYQSLPAVIVRPSIVSPAYKEPLAGWVDNLNGPIGLMVGAGKGVIRTMLCDGELLAQVISVDTAINAIITLTQQEATKKEKSLNVPVYNLSSGDVTPTSWGTILVWGEKYAREHPFEWPLWYPNGTITTNVFVHYLKVVLFHLAPAYFIDFILLICGQKRFMIRVQNKVSQGLELLQYFTTRAWSFKTDNFKRINTELNPVDKELFPQDLNVIDPEAYIATCIEGGRLYCLKESPAGIRKARVHHNILYVLDWTFKILFCLYILWALAGWIF